MNSRGPVPETDDPALAYARQLTLIVYILHAVMSVTVISFFIAICINYSRHDRARGTIYESHFDWQIGAFWYTLVFLLLGAGLVIWGAFSWNRAGMRAVAIIIAGIVLLFCTWCWHLYRVIRGLMRWGDRRPMPN